MRKLNAIIERQALQTVPDLLIGAAAVCRTGIAAARMSVTDAAREINARVNAAIDYASDSDEHGQRDVWLTGTEAIERGRDDCEGYAYAKCLAGERARLDTGFAIVWDRLAQRGRGQWHAVCLIRDPDAGGWLVLDNQTLTIWPLRRWEKLGVFQLHAIYRISDGARIPRQAPEKPTPARSGAPVSP